MAATRSGSTPKKCRVVVAHAGNGTYLVGVGAQRMSGRSVYREALWHKGTASSARTLGRKIAKKQGCR